MERTYGTIVEEYWRGDSRGREHGWEDGAQDRKALVSEDLGRTDKNVDLRFARFTRGCPDSNLPLNHLFMSNS